MVRTTVTPPSKKSATKFEANNNSVIKTAAKLASEQPAVSAGSAASASTAAAAPGTPPVVRSTGKASKRREEDENKEAVARAVLNRKTEKGKGKSISSTSVAEGSEQDGQHPLAESPLPGSLSDQLEKAMDEEDEHATQSEEGEEGEEEEEPLGFVEDPAQDMNEEEALPDFQMDESTGAPPWFTAGAKAQANHQKELMSKLVTGQIKPIKTHLGKLDDRAGKTEKAVAKLENNIETIQSDQIRMMAQFASMEAKQIEDRSQIQAMQEQLKQGGTAPLATTSTGTSSRYGGRAVGAPYGSPSHAMGGGRPDDAPADRARLKLEGWYRVPATKVAEQVRALVAHMDANHELLRLEVGQGLVNDCHIKFKPCGSTDKDCVAVAWVFKHLIDPMKVMCVGPSSRQLKIKLGMSNLEASHSAAVNTFRHFLHTLREDASLPKAVRWSIWPTDGSCIPKWPMEGMSEEDIAKATVQDKDDPLADFVDGDYRRGKWSASFNRTPS